MRRALKDSREPANSFTFARTIDNSMAPSSLMLLTQTSTSCPRDTTSLALTTTPFDIFDRGTRPVRPAPMLTKAPKCVMFVTSPESCCPTPRAATPSPSPSPSCCVATPATMACMDHCAFSMSLRAPASSAARASHFSCSFVATFSLASTCLRSSAMTDWPVFWLSTSACKSDSRFFSLDSVMTTSLASFECSSSIFFRSFEAWVSRLAERSFSSFWASFSRSSKAFKSVTNCLRVFSISSSCWFLFSKRCVT
mmetsp:Transcript_95016/g.268502  ORF Transcript_95016/g.268502 Transcript_95016/m.268502 type:complete len:253 (+) Transcript_95016:1533-2291(+)